MARRRFFVPEVRRGAAELTGRDAEHLVRVLRAEPGQIYEISDNRDVYLAEIETARKSVVSFRMIEKLEPAPPSVQITLIAALIKFDRLEWLIEKATELGVSAIQPFEATRSERGLAQAAAKRLARWERIALEASEQSRRAVLPRIASPVRFAKVLATDANVRLLLDETPDVQSILNSLPQSRMQTDHVACLLGPEGGWTDAERQQAAQAGWTSSGLGPTILRTETAGVAALAVIQAVWHVRRAEKL
jgi:16S rRNA (uracil1498-N3)-methyltransferase